MGRGAEQAQRAKGQKFTLAEVAKHRTPGDAWMVCRGKVYDVSARRLQCGADAGVPGRRVTRLCLM